MELEFRVTGGIISGLKYIQVAKRAGLQVDKMEEMVGSYGPSQAPVVKRFAAEEAPSGKEPSPQGVRPFSQASADSLGPLDPLLLQACLQEVPTRCARAVWTTMARKLERHEVAPASTER